MSDLKDGYFKSKVARYHRDPRPRTTVPSLEEDLADEEVYEKNFQRWKDGFCVKNFQRWEDGFSTFFHDRDLSRKVTPCVIILEAELKPEFDSDYRIHEALPPPIDMTPVIVELCAGTGQFSESFGKPHNVRHGLLAECSDFRRQVLTRHSGWMGSFEIVDDIRAWDAVAWFLRMQQQFPSILLLFLAVSPCQGHLQQNGAQGQEAWFEDRSLAVFCVYREFLAPQ